MEATAHELVNKLLECRDIVQNGYTSTKCSGISWLNNFCGKIENFASMLHKFLIFECCKEDEIIETMFLCLTQITTCIRHVERTIKSEKSGGRAISASRQHFLDRILWCLDRIKSAIESISKNSTIIEESNFVTLMDRVLEKLLPFSSFNQGTTNSNIAEESAEAMFASKEIRSLVDQILSHTLAFANVTLKKDKKIVSILCQNTIRDCIAFQEECSFSNEEKVMNKSERKLKAMSLENSLYHLEDFINESLLRLVFRTFLDYSKFSIPELRSAMQRNIEDSLLDEVIADFDVNIDRTTQIGIFAIAFAPNIRIKTVVRSCLASLESLDSCIIPSLQSNLDVYSEILEQHFNEEIEKFKAVIQDIIDSNAFIVCYLEMLSEVITTNSQQVNKDQLSDILGMGIILKEHLLLNNINLEFDKHPDKQKKKDDFVLMLEECQAILACFNQVESERVIKRFKILRSVLSKLKESLAESRNKTAKKSTAADIFVTSNEMCESEKLLESFGIEPSITGILYRKDINCLVKTDSLKPNCSRLNPSLLDGKKEKILQLNSPRLLRRKDSLRTIMFKRQKANESDNLYKLHREQFNAHQISDIFSQVTNVSLESNLSILET